MSTMPTKLDITLLLNSADNDPIKNVLDMPSVVTIPRFSRRYQQRSNITTIFSINRFNFYAFQIVEQ